MELGLGWNWGAPALRNQPQLCHVCRAGAHLWRCRCPCVIGSQLCPHSVLGQFCPGQGVILPLCPPLQLITVYSLPGMDPDWLIGERGNKKGKVPVTYLELLS